MRILLILPLMAFTSSEEIDTYLQYEAMVMAKEFEGEQ
jgi:hypothetical protein